VNEEFRDYYYNFGLAVVSLYNESPSNLSDYKPIIKKYIKEYFREVMKVPCTFKVEIDYFETTSEDTKVSSFLPNDDVVYKEFVIRCKLSLDINDNNRIKITNPSKYQYMRDNESQFLKKFVHIT